MKKFLTYILILVALVGAFSFVPTKQAKADQCVLTGWTYTSCHNGTSALDGSIYTGTKNTTAGSQETCTTGDTNMSSATCQTNYGGKWYASPNKPPSTQEGVSIVTSSSPVVGGMCTGQDASGNNTPSGCNATIAVPGSTCIVTRATIDSIIGVAADKIINGFNSDCNGKGTLDSGGTFSSPKCTIYNWSPTSCNSVSWGNPRYYAPGTTSSTGTASTTSSTTSYTLLAPLPCQSGDASCVNGQVKTFDPTQANNLSGYLNLMIKIFIGICAALAVIMIVMGGIEYMTSELISNKEAGKQRIRGAIFGLLLALCAWTLLYTINPNLLKSDLSSVQTATVTVTLQDETETADTAVTSDGGAPSGATAGCPAGIGRTTNGISVCNSIVSQVNSMIKAATASGINLTGGGYRSIASQTALRVAHCNGNTTDRSASCTPPTAIPGASRHQQGLAIDFKCDGSLIRNNTNKCYVWLASNANKYGLANLASEPWHWSTDGR